MSHGGLGHTVGEGPSTDDAPQGVLEQAAHRLGLAATLGYALVSCVGSYLRFFFCALSTPTS